MSCKAPKTSHTLAWTERGQQAGEFFSLTPHQFPTHFCPFVTCSLSHGENFLEKPLRPGIVFAKLFYNILFCFTEPCSFGYGLKVMCQSGLPPLNPQGWGEGGCGTVTKISINRWGIYSQEVLLVLFSIFPHESSVESSTI